MSKEEKRAYAKEYREKNKNSNTEEIVIDDAMKKQILSADKYEIKELNLTKEQINKVLGSEEIKKIDVSYYRGVGDYKIFLPNRKMIRREYQLRCFAEVIKKIQSNDMQGKKIGSRDWGYRFELDEIITKQQIDNAQEVINQCRKRGFLPIDFVIKDETRKLSMTDEPTEDIDEEIKIYYGIAERFLDVKINSDFWADKDCFIQAVTEKRAIRDLFEPVFKEYQIKICNAKGWSDINQRAELIENFVREAEEKGKKPILLYFGDYDIEGIKISDTLKKNLEDLKNASCGYCKNLIVDRFGLNYDFIIKNKIKWINNLETAKGCIAEIKNGKVVQGYIKEGSGKKPHPFFYHKTTQEYLKLNKKFNKGVAKVEANAIIMNTKTMEAGKKELIKTLKKHLGWNFQEKWEKTKQRDMIKVSRREAEVGIDEEIKEEIREHLLSAKKVVEEILEKKKEIKDLKQEIEEIKEETEEKKNLISNLKELEREFTMVT